MSRDEEGAALMTEEAPKRPKMSRLLRRYHNALRANWCYH